MMDPGQEIFQMNVTPVRSQNLMPSLMCALLDMYVLDTVSEIWQK